MESPSTESPPANVSETFSYINSSISDGQDTGSELFISAPEQAMGQETSLKGSETMASNLGVAALPTRIEDSSPRVAPKTVAHTAWCTGVWRAWATRRLNRPREDAVESQHQLLEDFNAMAIADLAFWMGKFILEMRRTDGGYYPADTVYSIISGLNRSLRSCSNGKINVLKDPHFASAREILESEKRRLRAAAREQQQQLEASPPLEPATYYCIEPVGLHQTGIPSSLPVEHFSMPLSEQLIEPEVSQEAGLRKSLGGNRVKSVNVGQVAKKTLNQTAWCGRIWSAWAQRRKQETQEELQHSLLLDFNLMAAEDIAFWLGKFFLEVRRSDGNPYLPESLSNIFAGLNRLLKYSGRTDTDLIRDPIFSNSRDIFGAELARLRCSEPNQRRTSSIVSGAEENVLWEKGLLGDHNAQVLVDTLVYYITYCFGLRGADHRKLRHNPSQLQLFEPSGSTPFLVYTEDVTEDIPHRNKLILYMNTENSERCLVRLYKLYNSHCPAGRPDNAFYLRPIFQPKSHIWYEASPMGQNFLCKTIGRLFQKAGIEGNFSNASLLSQFSSRLSSVGSDDQDTSPTTYKIVTILRDNNKVPHLLPDNAEDAPPHKRPRLSPDCCEPEIVYVGIDEQENEMSEELEFERQERMNPSPVEMEAEEERSGKRGSDINELAAGEKDEQMEDRLPHHEKHSMLRQLSTKSISNDSATESVPPACMALPESAFSSMLANEEGRIAGNPTVPHRTAIQTSWCTGLWKAWATARLSSPLECADAQHELLLDFTAMSPKDIAYWLKKFILEIRKADSEPYSPDSVYSIFAGLNRSLKLSGRGEIGILRDPIFAECREVLENEMSRLQATGNFTRKSSTSIGIMEENTLWAKGILGDHSPQALVDTLLYYFTFYFGIRGGEHRRLRHYPSQIQLFEPSEGVPYLLYNEDGSKNAKNHQLIHYRNTDNPERCLVRLYKLYNSKCPQDRPNNAFYLRPVARLKYIGDPMWYENSPIGHNVLTKTISRLFEEAGVKGNYTNQSIRNTSTSKFFHPDAIDQLIKTLRSTSGPSNSADSQPFQKIPASTSEDQLANPSPEKAHQQECQSNSVHGKAESRAALIVHSNGSQVSGQNSNTSASVIEMSTNVSTIQATLPSQHLNTSQLNHMSSAIRTSTIAKSSSDSSEVFAQSSQTATEECVNKIGAPVSLQSSTSTAQSSTSRPELSQDTTGSSCTAPKLLSSDNTFSRSVESGLKRQQSRLDIPEIAALLRAICPEIVAFAKRQATQHEQKSATSSCEMTTSTSEDTGVSVNVQNNKHDTTSPSSSKRTFDSTASSHRPTQPKVILSSTGFDISVPGCSVPKQNSLQETSTPDHIEDADNQRISTKKVSCAEGEFQNSKQTSVKINDNTDYASPEKFAETNTTPLDDRSKSSTSSSSQWSTSLPNSVASILQSSGTPIIITGGLTINFNFN